MVMPPGEPFPGPFSYDLGPYWREPVDRIAPSDPTVEVTIMTVNQIGKTAALINAWIAYTISENPGPIQYLTGHQDGNAEAMRRIDEVFDACGFREKGLIQAQSQRARKTKSGDTDVRKDFLGGHLVMGVLTNVKKDARQHTIKVQIRDDMDAAPISGKSGDTATAYNSRLDSFGSRRKIANISTAELAGMSNIEKAWNRSDKRYYNVPCPASTCGKLSALEWEIDMGKEKAGLHWKLDGAGRLVESSIEYICPHCGNGWKEKEKYEMNLAGVWIPTVLEPVEKLHRGYTLNALYPVRMRSFATLINHYMLAYPSNAPKDDKIEQTFYNLVLAKPYAKSNDDIKATDLQIHNKRPYLPGIVPEDLSIRDGNGPIWFLFCSLDLNGVFLNPNRVDDVRIDGEILAVSETGQTYSVDHFSIGTFIYRETEEQKAIHREKWTYDFTKPNCVWPELDRILAFNYPVSGSVQTKKIIFTVMDTGNWEHAAFQYIDKNKFFMVGVKGTGEDKNKPLHQVTANFKRSVSRSNLYVVDGNSLKSHLSGLIRMKWRIGTGESQPVDFMNYPTDPEGKKYQYDNFFAHYEAEHKVNDTDKNGNAKGYVWKKKGSNLQNHFFDCRVYLLAAIEIFLALALEDMKKDNPTKWKDRRHITWQEFVAANK